MIGVFSSYEGNSPLLVSVPHEGCHVPADICDRMTPAGRAVPDTDWHVAELYEFARHMGASMLVANYSRFVVDLNRSASDDVLYPGQVVTGLCPVKTFAGDDIYIRDGGVTDNEKALRVDQYWRPYHEKLKSMLEGIKARYGYALLWDAHSIPSVVPRLFEGELPVLNIGTNSGASCEPSLEAVVVAAAEDGPYSIAVNDRFKGGYITRAYGNPVGGIHAVQLEIAQRAYMDEVSALFDARKAAILCGTLRRMLAAFSAD